MSKQFPVVNCARCHDRCPPTNHRRFHSLGVKKLDVIKELLSGMPLTQGITATKQEQFVILKAGNHGTKQTLAELIQ